tara:strand:+ start:581 stop:826 length:246 start_codon:yes stop_codon:yes gene_type:complete
MLKTMIGGGVKNVCKSFGKDQQLYLFAMGILILLIKTLIVQWTYNQVWPKLVLNSGNNPRQFIPLTFYEALLFVLLFEFLF